MRSHALPPDRVLRLTFVALLGGFFPGCDGAEEPATSAAVQEVEILEQITRPGDGGSVHLVRLVQSGDAYSFEPAELAIPPGDVVRFVMVGSQPESVAFETGGLSSEMAAFVRNGQLDRGVLLTDPGAAYDVSFGEAPPGRYPFHSEPHEALGMRGAVTIVE